MNQLICFDCHIRRRVIAPVLNEAKQIVGWRCKKCVQKLYVGGGSMPRGEGKGWRRQFNDFVDALRKREDEKKRQIIVGAKVNEPVKQKETIGNKIKSFFRRKTT